MSDRDTCYFLKPEPGGDELLALAQSLSDMGYSLSCLSKSMVCRLEAKEILREHGARSVLTWGLMNEAVLPDNTPRDELLDTLRYQHGRCAATETLLVIACQARGGNTLDNVEQGPHADDLAEAQGVLAFCVDKAFRNTTILAERLALPLYRQDVAAARKGFNDLSRIERPLEDDYSCPALDGARRLFDSLATMTEGRALTGHRRPRRPKEEGPGGSVTSASRAAKQDWRPYLWDTAAVAAEEAAVRKALAQGTSRWHRGPTARSRFERRARALWSSDSATTVGRVGVWDTEGLAHWMRGSNRARAAGFSLAIRGHSVGDACGRRRSGGRARARALGGARHPPPGQAPSPCPEADVAKDRFES